MNVEPVYKAQNSVFGISDYPFLVEMIRRANARTVLDIGTGEGSFLIDLAQKAPDVSYDAIDLNENLIDIAKSNVGPLALPVQFRHERFDQNYARSGYDLIFARFAVEHISDLGDVDTFILATLEKLRPGGWLALIEYYVHDLDIKDPVWRKFRRCELRTYQLANAHPRIGLRLPESLSAAGYKNIKSTLNHISPSTVGSENFFRLVWEYTQLYSSIAPECWSESVIRKIRNWCEIGRPHEEPHLLTSYTVGQRQDISTKSTTA